MDDFPLKKITRVIRGIPMTLPDWCANDNEEFLYNEYIRCQTNYQRGLDHMKKVQNKIEMDKMKQNDIINYQFKSLLFGKKIYDNSSDKFID
jgi:hypothetical protein